MTTPKRAAVDRFPAGPAAPPTPLAAPVVSGVGTPSSSPPPFSSVPRGVAARIQTPPRSTLPANADGTDVLLGGSRTFTITLPAGMKLLSLNDRLHWRVRNSRAQELKRAAWVMALNAKVPRLERVSVVVEYQPPDRRRRDPDNIAISAKALIDGCVAARCLPGDDSRYVTGVQCTIGEVFPRGRLVLYLTEVAGPIAGAL